MKLIDELRQIHENAKKDARFFYEMIKLHPVIYLIFLIICIIASLSLILLPPWRVSHFEIYNPTTVATLENEYRVTLAQIIGGSAVLLSLYFAWGNIKTSKEGQITESFTRAIDQLGNENLQIKLGGIHALERISNESDKDYWPIMEILTVYIRNKSSLESKDTKTENVKNQKNLSLDIQAILTAIGRRKYFFNSGELNHLDLHETCLYRVNFEEAHLEKVNLRRSNLKSANLKGVHLEGADLRAAMMDFANFEGADLEGADLLGANLKWANLKGANLKGANLEEVHFEGADLEGADLEGADLEGAYLKKMDESPKSSGLAVSCNVSFNQLSKVKTLYKANLDEALRIKLETKYPALFKPTGKYPEDEF